MRNCLVLGSGRSGTSMVAGCLHAAGYWMGDDLMPPSEGNPRGYFESRAVESINEELLMSVSPRRPRGCLQRFFRHRLGSGQRWLAQVPVGSSLRVTDALVSRMRSQLRRAPYCLKDPRFCYTLSAWRPHLGDAVFVCVFREPSRTADSILRECDREPYLRDLPMDRQKALEVWRLSYRHVLDIHSKEGSWLFMHYEQMLTSAGFKRLEQFLGTSLDRSFVEPSLRRSAGSGAVSAEIDATYADLCERAGFRPN